MNNESTATYLEGLLRWADRHVIELNRNAVENYWLSLPVPTRRFGPDAWVIFSMTVSPGREEVGPFGAWYVLSNETPRVIAYLESPLADTFGLVEPFTMVAGGLGAITEQMIAALGVAGAAFFAREDATTGDAAAAQSFLDHVEGDLSERLSGVAPDFFGWAKRGVAEAGS